MKTLKKKIQNALVQFANMQWYIVMIFLLFVASIWFAETVVAAVCGPLVILSLFWLALVKFKVVKKAELE